MSATLRCCPNIHSSFTGLQRDPENHLKYRFLGGSIRCKSWSCPYCREKNLKVLKARIYNGALMNDPRNNKKYNQKFLTLTYGGNDLFVGPDRKRIKGAGPRAEALKMANGNQEIAKKMAYEYMTECLHKLMRAIQKSYGKFYYFRVA